ncbi:MAG: hypothetical protein ACOX7G_10345, partial [Candidatus Scatomorpha sp.]
PRPPRQERSREWWSRRGKKALFFGGSTPFLWASTKEMGSNRSKGYRPPPKVSAHTQKRKEKQKVVETYSDKFGRETSARFAAGADQPGTPLY